MKKIILGVLALAVFTSFGFANAQGTTGTKISTEANISCAQTAVVAREEAVKSAFDKFSASISSALATRAAELSSAWNITVPKERQTARSTAWNKYRTASTTARTTFKNEKRTAWNNFKNASKACKVQVVESETNDNLTL